MTNRPRGLPYETASSGKRALQDMQDALERFGAQAFGTMFDYERSVLVVQFRHRGYTVVIEASVQGYAAAWLRAHPWSHRMHRSKLEHEREANRVAQLATYSILRDWLKGQVAAIECGVLSFEGAFLGQIMLPNGQTAQQAVRGMLASGTAGNT